VIESIHNWQRPVSNKQIQSAPANEIIPFIDARTICPNTQRTNVPTNLTIANTRMHWRCVQIQSRQPDILQSYKCSLIFSTFCSLLNKINDIVKCIIDDDRLCGLVVRFPAYISRGPGFGSRRYQTFWEVLGPERGPLSLVKITEELLEQKSSGSGSRKSILTTVGIRCAHHATPSVRKNWH
jgi:hypothetical protein